MQTAYVYTVYTHGFIAKGMQLGTVLMHAGKTASYYCKLPTVRELQNFEPLAHEGNLQDGDVSFL